MVDFPAGVAATDPTQLLGANATVPAKQAIGAAGRALLAAAGADFGFAAGALTISGAMTALAYRVPTSGALANSVLIGTGATTAGSDAIAIGTNASAPSAGEPIAIGLAAEANGVYTLAIGRQARALSGTSVALGFFAVAGHSNGVALGYQASTTKANQIMLGNASNHTEITIPATTEATSTTAAALVVAGGIASAKVIIAGGNVHSGSSKFVGANASLSLSTINVWVATGFGAVSGLVVIRDQTNGTQGVYAVDAIPSSTTILAQTDIEVRHTGTDIEVRFVSGAARSVRGVVLVVAQ